MQQPENLESPALARMIHAEVVARIDGLAPLPSPLPVAPASEAIGQDSLLLNESSPDRQPNGLLDRVHDVEMMTTGFDEMFVEEYSKLVALGVSMSGDREVACELAQETMLRAHQRWDEVARFDVPGAWLRRVMSNLLIDHHRSATSERRAVERLASQVPASGEPELVVWGELMAVLTPQQRLVASLFYGDDQSVGQIAAAIGISTGGVKSTLSKVRRRLRNHTSVRSAT